METFDKLLRKEVVIDPNFNTYPMLAEQHH